MTYTPATCLGENTLIYTQHGQVAIKDIKVGDTVWTELGWQLVTAQWLAKSNSPTLKLTDVMDNFIEATDDHPLYIVRDHQVMRVMAKDITIADYIIFSKFNNLDQPYLASYLTVNVFNNSTINFNQDVIVLNARLSLIRIKSIEPGRAQNVYDITVDNAHHFYANGMLSHNCKHTIALLNYVISNKL